MLVWLGICAILSFVAAVAALLFAVPPAPTLHLAFAAGAMPLICGAILHFVPVLTRSAAATGALARLPLAVQLAGIVTPLALGGVLPYAMLYAAALLTALAALGLALWVGRRMRNTLGAPHPGARWYAAALLCLLLAVGLVPLWLAWPDLRPALRLAHLHFNLLGFIGLAALGTLPLLVPTVLHRPEPDAGRRLRSDLWPALAGVVLIALGSAAGRPMLAVAGALALGWVVLRNLWAWGRCFRGAVGAGGTAPLVAAAVGLLVLLLAGLAHGFGALAPRPALAAYLALFLLPLVSGALAQLLPVWRLPGPESARRQHLTVRLAAGGRLRAALFLGGGTLLLFDAPAGLVLAAAGLLLFVAALLRALWLDSRDAGDDNPAPVP